jgi:two-component system LytT family response regulator
MTRAVIIDDDEENVKLITRLIETNYLPINILGSSNTKDEAVALINQVNPNLIFMDINLDDNNTGFDVLEEVTQLDAKIIFVTSFNEFAIKAFNYNTIGYIVKPIEKSNFILAVNKAVKEIENHLYTKNSQLESLRNTLNYDTIQIAVSSIKDIELVKLKNIIYLSSDSRYTHFFLKGGKRIMSSNNLGKYENLIQGNFFRIHAKYYVNLDFLHKIHKDAGSSYCEMKNGDLLTISQRKYSDFMKFLNLK